MRAVPSVEMSIDGAHRTHHGNENDNLVDTLIRAGVVVEFVLESR